MGVVDDDDETKEGGVTTRREEDQEDQGDADFERGARQDEAFLDMQSLYIATKQYGSFHKRLANNREDHLAAQAPSFSFTKSLNVNSSRIFLSVSWSTK